jgi:hypothetical protein
MTYFKPDYTRTIKIFQQQTEQRQVAERKRFDAFIRDVKRQHQHKQQQGDTVERIQAEIDENRKREVLTAKRDGCQQQLEALKVNHKHDLEIHESWYDQMSAAGLEIDEGQHASELRDIQSRYDEQRAELEWEIENIEGELDWTEGNEN